MGTDEPLRVLLIEDNQGDARLIREMLRDTADLSRRLTRDEGDADSDTPRLLHEENLPAGLETYENNAIDVVLLDLNLPGSRELETLRTFREQASTVPVVVLTGLADRGIGIRALKQGADEFLVKDEINASVLVRSIYHAIERHSQERELVRYQALIQESTDVNTILDREGTFTYVTPSIENVLGYSPDALVGESAFDYIHPDDREETRRALDDLIEGTGDRRELEFRFQHADDSWVWLESRGRNMLDNPMLEGLVIYTRDVTERREYERELRQYERLFEESTDVNAVLDPDGTFRYLTPSVQHVLGYEQAELTGELGFDYIHPEDRDEAMEEFFKMVEDPDYRPKVEFRFKHADGSWVILEARGRNLLDDELVEGIVAYTRDVTERKKNELRLATLNDLNEIFQESIEDLVETDRRQEIEQGVSDRLVESDLYDFAWVGTFDQQFESLEPRAYAGTPTTDADALASAIEGGIDAGPSVEAAKTSEPRFRRGMGEKPADTNWREFAAMHGLESVIAVPIRNEDVLYGVLTIYTTRSDAFDQYERTIITRFGDVVGHAIAAMERKHALTSEEVLEVEFYLDDLPYEDVSLGAEGRIRYDRTVPIGNGTYVVYGTATQDAFDALHAFEQHAPGTEAVWIHNEEAEESRFEARLGEESLVGRAAARNGHVEQATITDGSYQLTVRLPPTGDIRELFEAIKELYPEVELVAQRRTERDGRRGQLTISDLVTDLTERQRSVLESAYSAGYFEWPRERTGEDLAETIAISPSTLHQHLRAGERKILGTLFEED